MTDVETFTAFQGDRQVVHGPLVEVARAVSACAPEVAILIFSDATGHPVELDLRQGPEQAVSEYRKRNATLERPAEPPRRGRPRLGVVAREVTLLPRHWEWLSGQPGGASAALRRLVEDARRAAAEPDRARRTRETLYRAMSALAGDLPGFEEASRALFAGDAERFERSLAAWPADVSAFLRRLARADQG